MESQEIRFASRPLVTGNFVTLQTNCDASLPSDQCWRLPHVAQATQQHCWQDVQARDFGARVTKTIPRLSVLGTRKSLKPMDQ